MAIMEIGDLVFNFLQNTQIIFPGLINLFLAFIFSFAIARSIKKIMILMFPVSLLWAIMGAVMNPLIMVLLIITCGVGIWMNDFNDVNMEKT